LYGVVGGVGYDGVGVCGFPVYGYVDVGVVSVDGDIQKVDFVVVLYFFGELYVWVCGVEAVFYVIDVGMAAVIYDEYIVYVTEVIDNFVSFRYGW
jgi:hypothetical protein